MIRFSSIPEPRILVLSLAVALPLCAQRIHLLDSPGSPMRSLGEIPLAQRVAVPEAGSRLLVLTAEGRVWEWDALRPDLPWSQVSGLEPVRAVAAGAMHGAALDDAGAVWTWGANDQGQLGNGELTARAEPRPVAGLDGAVAVAVGKAYTLVLRRDGSVWMFGSNWNKVAPADPRRLIADPVAVSGLAGIEAIAVYRNRGYARGGDGRLIEWGLGADAGGEALPHAIGIEDPALLREVERRLSHSTAASASIDASWLDDFGLVRPVRLTGSRLEAGSAALTLDGAVVDADLGWAVAVIANSPGAAGPSGAEAAADPPASGKDSARGAVFAVDGPRFTSSSANLASAVLHSYFLTQAGTVCVWGDNSVGQLGDGTAVNRSTPVTAADLSAITMVSAGWQHGIALKSDGTVWTWGDNTHGQLGDGTTSGRPSPNPVPGLTGVTAVAAGGFHSLALKGDGTVWTWGRNDHGQLGDSSNSQRLTPVQVTGLTGITAIAAGELFSIARRNDGTVVAWGLNASGQLGDGSTTSRNTAAAVSGLTNVAMIAAGRDHAMVRKVDGTVWSWGANSFGQLGDGTNANRSAPVQSAGLTTVVAISAGANHSLAALGNGTVFAWGQNSSAQLGDGTGVDRNAPVMVTGLTSIAGVVGGAGHSVALRSDGALFSWGTNLSGALGNGGIIGSTVPVPVTACESGVFPSVTVSARAKRLAAARDYALVVRTDGIVQSWGRNDAGQLGDGTTTNRNTPVTVLGVGGASAVSAGWSHALALKSDGTARAWGSNSFGQLGTGDNLQQLTSVLVPGLSGITGVAGGGFHSVAVKNDGTVWAWGLNADGQLGTGNNTGSNSPVQVPGLTGMIAVAAGERHSLALKNDGTVWAWGFNSSGQLGDLSFASRNVPVRVAGLTNAIAISAGTYHSLALKSDGTVWGWGYNGSGGLGDGTTINRSGRVRASGLTSVVAIGGADSHSLAARSDGSTWAWGLNSSGQLGDATNTARLTPNPVSVIAGTVAVAGGISHSVAMVNSESIWAWGSNSVGQFGTPSPAASNVPVLSNQLPFCTYFINPAGAPFPDAGGTGQASVFTALACSWTATADVPWISVSSTVNVGNGTFSYIVSPNSTTSSRSGTITVGNRTFLVQQSAGSGCTYSISPTTVTINSAGGTGQVNVTTAPGCSWSAQTVTFFLSVVSGSSGTGSGAVTYSVAANGSTAERVGTISIAGQTFTVTQSGIGGGSTFMPNAGVPSPSSGSGTSETISFTFNDGNGASDLAVLNVLVNNVLDGRNACYLAYLPSGPTTGLLVLVNNNGDAGGPFAGSLAIPGSGLISNGQCVINGFGSSASMVGDTLTLTLNMSFTGNFTGNRVMYMAARDILGNNSGWRPLGVWNVPGAPSNGTSVVSLAPARATSTTLPVTAVFSDVNGFADLEILNLLVNNAIDGRAACYIAYLRSTNTVVLVNDNGDAGGPFAGSMTIPGSGSITNSQCGVSAVGSSTFGSGNTLTLNLNFTFAAGFRGDRIVYAAARDTIGTNSGWQAVGTITIP